MGNQQVEQPAESWLVLKLGGSNNLKYVALLHDATTHTVKS